MFSRLGNWDIGEEKLHCNTTKCCTTKKIYAIAGLHEERRNCPNQSKHTSQKSGEGTTNSKIVEGGR